MKTALTAGAFAFLLLSAGGARSAEIGWLVFASGNDRLPLTGDQVQVALPERAGSSWLVGLKLAADPARAFADLTQAHVGDAVEVHLCGVLLMRPKVLAPITSGAVMLTIPDDGAAAARLKALQDKTCPGDGG